MNLLTAFFLTIIFFAFAMLIMGVGVIFSNRCLQGSCGGPSAFGPDGEDLRCAGCPKRDEEECEANQEPESIVQIR